MKLTALSIFPAVALFSVLVASASEVGAAAGAPQLCIRAGRGAVYAVGDGYARAACRNGDLPYENVAPATARGIKLCLVDAFPGTSISACVCDEGEVAEMVGPFSVYPPGLVYDLQSSPDWSDYRAIITHVTAEQSGSITLALRCAAE